MSPERTLSVNGRPEIITIYNFLFSSEGMTTHLSTCHQGIGSADMSVMSVNECNIIMCRHKNAHFRRADISALLNFFSK